jgi:predicted acylesterase/phospholipase RssA
MNHEHHGEKPQYCDLVLKGGLTSGVVYPGAIHTLSKRYRFRNLGGTSAGAIAAAFAAASELGRSSGRYPEAFAALAQLPHELGSPHAHSGMSLLLRLFRPSAQAKPVFRSLLAALGAQQRRPLHAIILVWLAGLMQFPLSLLLALLPALGFWYASGGVQSVLFLFVLMLTWLASSVATVALLMLARARSVFIAQGFGMVPGVFRDSRGKEDPWALSSWLDSKLAQLAGLGDDEVLTFGHLWRGAESSPHHGRKAIVLRVISTALNQRRPVAFPIEKDHGGYYFKAEDLERVLPKRVVAHMLRASRESEQEKGYFRLPDSEQLPVVFAVRLSLSFPVLMSAVRLYARDFRFDDPRQRMQPVWFSDGGICSNMPIQFFDAPLPTHPTFGIQFLDPHPERAETSVVPSSDQAGKFGYHDRFHEHPGLGGIMSFVSAVFNSAREWVDQSQMRLPGYRDRVGGVVLSEREGGLNLKMEQSLIEELSRRGAEVATGLMEVFDRPIFAGGASGWERHRWIRLRTQLSALAASMGEFNEAASYLELSLEELQNWVEQHPGTDDEQDRDPMHRQALRDFLGTLHAALTLPELGTIKDKSNAQLRLRPNP